MSRSYDEGTGRPLRPPGPAQRNDSFDDPATGSPGGALERMTPDTGRLPGGHRAARAAAGPVTIGGLEPQTRREPQSYGRGARRDKTQQAPIVPAGSVTSRSLTLVISIMCCLACLTAGAVYMIYQSAEAWRRDIASEVTVQVEPRQGADIEASLKSVAAFLRGQPGIQRVDVLPLDASQKLLEPWLGQSNIFATLPVPRLIALEIDRAAPPNFIEGLRAALGGGFQGVTLDDHRRWQRQIRTVTRSFVLGGFAILLLVACATIAVIISATNSAMLSSREIVEVLHFVGATDKLIAREFERHFLQLGVRAGLIGAGSAMLVFLLMPWIMRLMSGGPEGVNEMRRLVGVGGLDVSGYVLLGIVVVVISALCMLTSRRSVFRFLNTRQ